MKKQKKITILLIVLMIISSISITKVYADPNSSKGFAEYDDVQAEEETKQLLEEQQKQLEAASEKSTNNYLDNLQVEGYELSPQFDKQTIEYAISGNVNSDEINIIATPSDSKATVNGAGKVKIEQNQTEFRIDVTAESGTVRTYMIYINEQVKEQEQIQVEEQQKEQDEISEMAQEVSTIPESNSANVIDVISSNFNIVVIGLVIIICLFILVFIIKKKRNKGKHF